MWFSVILISMGLSSTAAASPWSFSAKAAAGGILGSAQATARMGLEVDMLHAIGGVVGLGLEGCWWEQLGTYGFVRVADLSRAGADKEHQGMVAVGAVIRARTRVGYCRPHLLVGAGKYLILHRNGFYDGSSFTQRQYAPGVSFGVGISKVTAPTLVLQARWHRVLANFDPYRSTLRKTDLLLISAGLNFN
jgi:hypothetical protein